MSIAVGIDLQPFAEVADSLRTFGDRYTRRLYTTAEIKGLNSNPDLASRELASMFATKEAVIKVLAPTVEVPSWLEIEVHLANDYAASISLSGTAAQLAHRKGITDI